MFVTTATTALILPQINAANENHVTRAAFISTLLPPSPPPFFHRRRRNKALAWAKSQSLTANR